MSLASQLPHTNNNSSNNSLNPEILGELFFKKRRKNPKIKGLKGNRSLHMLYREKKQAHNHFSARELFLHFVTAKIILSPSGDLFLVVCVHTCTYGRVR